MPHEEEQKNKGEEPQLRVGPGLQLSSLAPDRLRLGGQLRGPRVRRVVTGVDGRLVHRDLREVRRFTATGRLHLNEFCCACAAPYLLWFRGCWRAFDGSPEAQCDRCVQPFGDSFSPRLRVWARCEECAAAARKCKIRRHAPRPPDVSRAPRTYVWFATGGLCGRAGPRQRRSSQLTSVLLKLVSAAAPSHSVLNRSHPRPIFAPPPPRPTRGCLKPPTNGCAAPRRARGGSRRQNIPERHSIHRPRPAAAAAGHRRVT